MSYLNIIILKLSCDRFGTAAWVGVLGRFHKVPIAVSNRLPCMDCLLQLEWQELKVAAFSMVCLNHRILEENPNFPPAKRMILQQNFKPTVLQLHLNSVSCLLGQPQGWIVPTCPPWANLPLPHKLLLISGSQKEQRQALQTQSSACSAPLQRWLCPAGKACLIATEHE